MNRNNLKYFLFLICTAYLYSCKPKVKESRYPGFSEHPMGFYFKRLTIGDGSSVIQIGDSAYLQTVFADSTGNVLFNSTQHIMNGCLGFCKQTGNTLIEEALSSMMEGDSTQFLIVADTVYKQAFNIDIPKEIGKGCLISVFAKLIKIKTAAKIAFEKKQFDAWCTEMQVVEDAKLNEYFTKTKQHPVADSTGLYILSQSKGNGQSIFDYASVSVNYVGRLLDGTEFDNTYKTGIPMEYIPGNSGQLLKGLEIIAGRLQIGGKAKLIVPSRLAFGNDGSSTGLIPPFTPVIYEIEISLPKSNL